MKNRQKSTTVSLAIAIVALVSFGSGCLPPPNNSSTGYFTNAEFDSHAAGYDGNVGVVERVEPGLLVVNGVTYSCDADQKVDKEGYELAVSDIRPGWEVKLGLRGSRVRKLEVLRIPSVIDFPEYRGLKTRVAVGRVRLGNLSPELVQSSVDIQSAVESVLMAALQATGKFLVIDTRSRDENLNEIDFGRSGYANPNQAAPVGLQVPAEYIVRGHILSVGMDEKKGKGFGLSGIKVGSTKTEITMKMQLTLEEIATGITLNSFEQELKYSKGGRSFGVDVRGIASGLSTLTQNLDKLQTLNKVAGSGLEFSTNTYYESPFGEVIGMITNRLVEDLSNEIGVVPWSSVIVTVSGDNAVIRGGRDVGLQPGQTLTVYKSTGDLIDPETGERLGNLSAPVGELTVNQVDERVSVCAYSGKGRPQPGDRCE